MIRYDPSSPPSAELAPAVGEPGLRRHVYQDHLGVLQGKPERDEKAVADKLAARAARVPRRRSPPALEDPPPPGPEEPVEEVR